MEHLSRVRTPPRTSGGRVRPSRRAFALGPRVVAVMSPARVSARAHLPEPGYPCASRAVPDPGPGTAAGQWSYVCDFVRIGAPDAEET